MEAANRSFRTSLAPNENAEVDAVLAAAWIALGDATFAAAVAEGQAMTLEQAVAFALEEGRGS